MNLSQQTLLDLLKGQDLQSNSLTAIQMSDVYISSALLVTVMGFLKEQLWLQGKEDKKLGIVTSYKDFITPFFSDELAPVLFLKEFLTDSGSQKIKEITRNSEAIEIKVLSLIRECTSADQRSFVTESLKVMEQHFIQEEKDQEGRDQSLGHKGLRLYRTFDGLDDLFNLDYQLDRDMVVDHESKERLFQGSGVGVQSGYSTILLALHGIRAKEGDTVIDLGSGYGRVGLVCSLLRPDIHFTGYEYVPHRVDASNNASEFLDLQENLKFITQDLSLESFKIPDADVYYLYDPFSKETYHYILQQIVEVSKRKKIKIVTKGNARPWITEISNENSWPSPELIDDGNLCIFKSA